MGVKLCSGEHGLRTGDGEVINENEPCHTLPVEPWREEFSV